MDDQVPKLIPPPFSIQFQPVFKFPKKVFQKETDPKIVSLTEDAMKLYKEKKYQNAYEIYNLLETLNASQFSVNLGRGDCLRKLEKYDDALTSYYKAQEGCAGVFTPDKAALFNNKGLVYLKLNKFSEALVDFETAINLKPNPLFFCNKGNALYAKGENKESLEAFKEAQKLLKQGNLEDISKENMISMQEFLDSFVTQLEQLENTVLNKADNVLKIRQIMYVSRITSNLEDSQPQTIIEEGKLILDVKKKVDIIQQIPELYGYYDGCLFTLCQAFATASVVNSGLLQVDTGNFTFDTANKMISMIPFIGDKISTILQSTWDFCKDASVKKAASNLCKFATTQTEFDGLAQDVIAEIIIKRQDQIKAINPESYILPKWGQRFSKLYKALEKVNTNIYGERNETPMQKVGYKMATDLVEKYISNGNIYEGKPAINMPPSKKKLKLSELLEKLLEADILCCEKNLKFIEEEKKNNEEETVKKKKTSCCQIFHLSGIKYENELLNNQKLFEYCVHSMGVFNVLKLSSKLNKDLVKEAFSDYDIAIAGLLSLLE